MNNLDICSEYITDIPIDENPIFSSSDEAIEYLNAFKNVFDKMPDDKEYKISFNDDAWDFNQYYYNINNSNMKINFNVPKNIKNYLKFWVLYQMKEKKNIPSIYSKVQIIKDLLKNVFLKKNCNSIFILTNKDFIEEIESRDISVSTKYIYYECMRKFLYFLTFKYNFNLLCDLENLRELSIKYKRISKTEVEKRKTNTIPDEFFNKIIFVAIKNMRDENNEYNRRATACLLIMLSQLGLRINDLLKLEIDQLHKKTLSKIGKTTYFIHYKSQKPSPKYEEMLEFDIFCNELCTEAFKTLVKIRERCEFSKNNNFLYLLNHKPNSKDIFPVSSSRFKIEYRDFLFEELRDECLKKWKGIKPRKYCIDHGAEKKYVKAYFPSTPQYRVYLATKLYEHNIPLVYIEKYLAHLSEEMMGYYVRPKDTYQENIQYSEKIISEIVGDDITPLGGSFGKELKENLQQFIKENNFNIKNDIHEIVKSFGDKVIIRGKSGGVCIKTSIVPCAKDNKTNQIYCAYNLCPNLFHFYYMADVSYCDFKTLQETYTVMKENKQLRASQKELNKLKNLCQKRLIPELDELDFELNRKGENAIIEKYPTLRDIIKNKENIRKEINLWMNKK